jgi:hypothetical protein
MYCSVRVKSSNVKGKIKETYLWREGGGAWQGHVLKGNNLRYK